MPTQVYENEDSSPSTIDDNPDSDSNIPFGQVTQEADLLSSSEDDAVSFEEYINDMNNVITLDKNRYLLAACFGVVPNFDLKQAPYLDLSARVLPTNAMFKQELLRRNKNCKGLRQKKADLLINALKSEEYTITRQSDIDFILKSEKDMRDILFEGVKEAEEEATRKKENSSIKHSDRLRFIETVLSDEVKDLYKKSQDCLTRVELDSRNSVMRIVDFYEKVAEVFNDPEFAPKTMVILDLYKEFCESIKLHLQN